MEHKIIITTEEDKARKWFNTYEAPIMEMQLLYGKDSPQYNKAVERRDEALNNKTKQ